MATSIVVTNEVAGNRLANEHLEEDYIIVTENIEDNNSNKGSAVTASKDIGLIGFWDMSQDAKINVSIDAADNLGENNKELILNYSKQAVFSNGLDPEAAKNQTSDKSWPQILTALNQNHSEPLPQLDLSESNGTDTSKIHVLLTADNHPTGRNGQAMVTLTGDGRIIFVEITIFRADVLYNEGYLAHVLEHEMGHALGLSHANYMESVMYPRIVDVNGSLLGHITDCDEKGLISLYVHASKDVVLCD